MFLTALDPTTSGPSRAAAVVLLALSLAYLRYVVPDGHIDYHLPRAGADPFSGAYVPPPHETPDTIRACLAPLRAIRGVAAGLLMCAAADAAGVVLLVLWLEAEDGGVLELVRMGTALFNAVTAASVAAWAGARVARWPEACDVPRVYEFAAAGAALAAPTALAQLLDSVAAYRRLAAMDAAHSRELDKRIVTATTEAAARKKKGARRRMAVRQKMTALSLVAAAARVAAGGAAAADGGGVAVVVASCADDVAWLGRLRCSERQPLRISVYEQCAAPGAQRHTLTRPMVPRGGDYLTNATAVSAARRDRAAASARALAKAAAASPCTSVEHVQLPNVGREVRATVAVAGLPPNPRPPAPSRDTSIPRTLPATTTPSTSSRSLCRRARSPSGRLWPSA